jgi:hypothetical protein
LRAVQHLNALQIREVHRCTGLRRVIDVIDVDGNSGFEGVAEINLGDAAQPDRFSGTVVADRSTEVSIRNHRAQIIDIDQLAGFQILSAEHGDCDWRLLQILTAISCRDYNLLEAARILSGGVLRRAWRLLCQRLT